MYPPEIIQAVNESQQNHNSSRLREGEVSYAYENNTFDYSAPSTSASSSHDLTFDLPSSSRLPHNYYGHAIPLYNSTATPGNICPAIEHYCEYAHGEAGLPVWPSSYKPGSTVLKSELPSFQHSTSRGGNQETLHVSTVPLFPSLALFQTPIQFPFSGQTQTSCSLSQLSDLLEAVVCESMVPRNNFCAVKTENVEVESSSKCRTTRPEAFEDQISPPILSEMGDLPAAGANSLAYTPSRGCSTDKLQSTEAIAGCEPTPDAVNWVNIELKVKQDIIFPLDDFRSRKGITLDEFDEVMDSCDGFDIGEILEDDDLRYE
ncbi:hypothetical protein Drorol1_Dr00009071 [Drosera rotundifolia]